MGSLSAKTNRGFGSIMASTSSSGRVLTSCKPRARAGCCSGFRMGSGGDGAISQQCILRLHFRVRISSFHFQSHCKGEELKYSLKSRGCGYLLVPQALVLDRFGFAALLSTMPHFEGLPTFECTNDAESDFMFILWFVYRFEVALVCQLPLVDSSAPEAGERESLLWKWNYISMVGRKYTQLEKHYDKCQILDSHNQNSVCILTSPSS